MDRSSGGDSLTDTGQSTDYIVLTRPDNDIRVDSWRHNDPTDNLPADTSMNDNRHSCQAGVESKQVKSIIRPFDLRFI